MPSRPLPLEAVRVLDVSQVMAGPSFSMLFGDLGEPGMSDADLASLRAQGAFAA